MLNGIKGNTAIVALVVMLVGLGIFMVAFNRPSAPFKSKAADASLAPSDNHNPVLTTQSLPPGTTGTPYTAILNGYDQDASTDILTIDVDGIPQGLSLGKCRDKTTLENTFLNCPISGTPTRSGNFNLTVTLSDNHDGSVTRTLNLTVN